MEKFKIMDAAKSKKTARLDGIVSVEPLAEFTHMGFNFFVYKQDDSKFHVVEETTGRAVNENGFPASIPVKKIVSAAKRMLTKIGQDAITKEIQRHAKI